VSTAAAARDPRDRYVLPPEGMPLTFRVGRVGDRVAAALLDLAILVLSFLLLAWLLVSLGLDAGDGWLSGALMLVLFVLRNGYFVFFEHVWHGQTPGKRAFGLMVMDAAGAPLSSEAIWARNLTREVESFLPLVVLVQPGLLVSGGPGFVRIAAVLWVLLLLLLPLFNRDRRRAGDFVAGTLVVEAPRVALLPDLAGTRDTAAPTAPFTREELSQYGVYELQVLEELLRLESPHSEQLDVVARTIRRKLGREAPEDWPPELRPPHVFLTAFYRAQRARLEQDLLLGKARANKREGRAPRRG
jgi:uncharacterized RDD family membrane protein YckC